MSFEERWAYLEELRRKYPLGEGYDVTSVDSMGNYVVFHGVAMTKAHAAGDRAGVLRSIRETGLQTPKYTRPGSLIGEKAPTVSTDFNRAAGHAGLFWDKYVNRGESDPRNLGYVIRYTVPRAQVKQYIRPGSQRGGQGIDHSLRRPLPASFITRIWRSYPGDPYDMLPRDLYG